MKLPEEYEQEEIDKINPNIIPNSQDTFAIGEKGKIKNKKTMADRYYKIKNNEELYAEHKKNREWFKDKIQDDEYKAKYYERKKKEKKYVLLKMKLFSQF